MSRILFLARMKMDRMTRYNTRGVASRNSLSRAIERVPQNLYTLGQSAFAFVDPSSMHVATLPVHDSRSANTAGVQSAGIMQEHSKALGFAPPFPHSPRINVDGPSNEIRSTQQIGSPTVTRSSSFLSGISLLYCVILCTILHHAHASTC